jgi:cell division transport system permease protein
MRPNVKSNFNFGFFLRESMRAMRRNAAPSFAALATVTVTLVVVGVFIPIVQATRGAADSVRSRVEVLVYAKEKATSADDARILNELKTVPNVQKVVFESKAQALAQARKQDPAAYALLSSNPLPDTFHVYPNNPSNVLSIRQAILGAGNTGTTHAKLDREIASVSNHTNDTQKLLTVTRFVTITAALLALLLTVASVLLIGNTIRLSLFARRREIEVMKLVGATDWFIRWPFVIEGTIVGALGAVGAIVVLGVTKLALLDPLASNWTLIAAPRTISFVSLVLVLVLSGVGVSALGSGMSLRRFLRV